MLLVIGVILTAAFTSQVDLDAECVLYGDLTMAMLDAPVKVGLSGILFMC